MRQMLRLVHTQPQGPRARLIGDALGAIALFVLLYVALHLPLFF